MSAINYETVIKHFEKHGYKDTVSFIMKQNACCSKENAIRKSLDKIISIYKNINKSKNRTTYHTRIDEFFKTTYQFPSTKVIHRKNEVELLCQNSEKHSGEYVTSTLCKELKLLKVRRIIWSLKMKC